MKKVFKSNLYFLCILVLSILIPYPLSYLFYFLHIDDIKIRLLTSHIVIFIIPAIIYVLLSKESPKEIFKINKLHISDGLLIVILSFVCQPIVMFLSLVSQMFFDNNIGQVVNSIIDTPYIIFLLLFALMPAITEEITMRGIVLSGYKGKSVYVAAIITGLLFGIMHLDKQQFLYAAVLGVILALLVRFTNSIFASSLMHFLINGTQVTLQKLVYSSSSMVNAINEASEVSIKDYSVTEKISLLSVYGVLALGFSILAFFIIRAIKNNNIRRGTIAREDVAFRSGIISEEEKTDRVINVPFILIIAIYIVVMIFLY